MPSPERGVGIQQFRGLNQRLIVGSNAQETTSLDNVIVRNGSIYGRKGISPFDGITTPSASIIIGLFGFYRAGTSTELVVRMQPTTMQLWNSIAHTWDNITGTALTGTTTTLPQFTTLDDILMFTNEGHDRPRKYTGAGNTVVLGGTPPFAKALESYVGFLMLGNVSDDGITYNPLEIRYSDDPDTNWTLCTSNSIIVDETPGEIIALKVLGRQLLVYKADGIVSLTFVAGANQFKHDKLRFTKGLIAPLSVQSLGDKGHCFLGTDLNLYITNGQEVKSLPPNIQVALQETMPLPMARFAVSSVDEDQTTYHLFYSTSSSDVWLRGRLSYNYETGEFYRGHWDGHQFVRTLKIKTSLTSLNRIINSATDGRVYEMENGINDNGVVVKRIYDHDWQQYQLPGDKWLNRAKLIFRKKAGCTVRISASKNFQFDLPNTVGPLQYPKTFDLLHQKEEITYEIPAPIYGNWHNLRIEMFQSNSTNVCELRSIVPIFVPASQVSQETPKPAGSTSGTGV